MVRFVCSCLNIKLYVKGCVLEATDIAEHGLQTEVYQDDAFFSCELAMVHLDIEGIQQEYACLVGHRRIGDWMVAQCINCRLNTHAVRVDQAGNRVLVNCSLKGDATHMERLKRSDNYSELYQILIPTGTHHRVTTSLTRVSYDSVQEGLTKIQQQLNAFLMDEEAAMEERIRRYGEQQRANYAHLQGKSRAEKNTLIRLVLTSSRDEDTEEFASNEYLASPLSPTIDQTSSSVNGGGTRNLNLVNKIQSKSDAVASPTVRVKTSPSAQMSRSPENQDMFVLDGFAEPYAENANFDFESDEDEEETDDSSLSSNGSRDLAVCSSIYSSSMPVQIPCWPVPNKYGENSPQDGEYRRVPEDIAASIKALAQSVREDGTEIFGDLPRKTTRKFSSEKMTR